MKVSGKNVKRNYSIRNFTFLRGCNNRLLVNRVGINIRKDHFTFRGACLLVPLRFLKIIRLISLPRIQSNDLPVQHNIRIHFSLSQNSLDPLKIDLHPLDHLLPRLPIPHPLVDGCHTNRNQRFINGQVISLLRRVVP